jgi:cold shock CspA family protein
MMATGRVTGYFPQRGFGNIVDSLTGHKLIVYANYLQLLSGDVLKEGQEVEYDIEKKSRESWAVNVKFSLKQEEENKNGTP